MVNEYKIYGSKSANEVSSAFYEFIIFLGVVLDNDNDLTDMELVIIKRFFTSLSDFEDDFHIAMLDISKIKELLEI